MAGCWRVCPVHPRPEALQTGLRSRGFSDGNAQVPRCALVRHGSCREKYLCHISRNVEVEVDDSWGAPGLPDLPAPALETLTLNEKCATPRGLLARPRGPSPRPGSSPEQLEPLRPGVTQPDPLQPIWDQRVGAKNLSPKAFEYISG